MHRTNKMQSVVGILSSESDFVSEIQIGDNSPKT